ncbi:MAG: ECF transporter S component, partial [Bacilli bacterium]|nr:ECF transporter S component [Bacilli bacterium]
MNKRTINIISKMTICAMLLALGWVLPFLTGQIPQFGNMFLPMHLPVLIGGFVLGPWYGLFLGIVTPLTRSLLFT